jgi:hypothetical protein
VVLVAQVAPLKAFLVVLVALEPAALAVEVQAVGVGECAVAEWETLAKRLKICRP